MSEEMPQGEMRGSEGPPCPHCGHTYSRVIASRAPKQRDDYYRRRVCCDCLRRFTTYESAQKAA